MNKHTSFVCIRSLSQLKLLNKINDLITMIEDQHNYFNCNFRGLLIVILYSKKLRQIWQIIAICQVFHQFSQHCLWFHNFAHQCQEIFWICRYLWFNLLVHVAICGLLFMEQFSPIAIAQQQLCTLLVVYFLLLDTFIIITHSVKHKCIREVLLGKKVDF